MRSLLFVPGDDEKKLSKGLASGADVLLLDLEDSVSQSRKSHARGVLQDFIKSAQKTAQKPRLFVRVNAHSSGMTVDDIDAVMQAGPDGIILPKSESGDDVALLSARLAVREAENGLINGHTKIIAIATETARSLFHMGTYKDVSQRLVGLTWGAEDLSADLGAETNRLESGDYTDPYRLARAMCLFAASSAEVAAIDTVYTNFRDLDGLRAETEAARRDGFSGKLAIHPAQIAIINEVFTPSADAIARARKIIDYFKSNPDAGVVGIDGEMIDRPHIRRAERILLAAGLQAASRQ
jgi:citrate lyase subunit beta / citryl-CoA lyase